MHDVFCASSLSKLNRLALEVKKPLNKKSGKNFEICLKLTIKNPERRQWRRSTVFIVNFKRVLMFLSLTLNR